MKAWGTPWHAGSDLIQGFNSIQIGFISVTLKSYNFYFTKIVTLSSLNSNLKKTRELIKRHN